MNRLIESIAEGESEEVLLHLVVQGQVAPTTAQREWALRYPFLRLHSLPHRVSLTAARNHVLRSLALSENDIVGFPDDDCFYPPDLFGSLRLEFASTDCDVVGGSYSDDARGIATARFSPTEGAFDFDKALRYASSITVFYRAHVVNAIGTFDERFGLGAQFGSAEDNDYLIRALKAGYSGRYRPTLIIGHPVRSSKRGQYFSGGVALLWKHRDVSMYRALLLRRVAGGLRLVMQRELSLAAYLTAFFRCGSTRGRPGTPLDTATSPRTTARAMPQDRAPVLPPASYQE